MRAVPGEEADPDLPAWQVVFTRQSQKDALTLASAGLRPKAEALPAILRLNPFQTPPPYEKLGGDLAGAYSRWINIQHRLVYEVDKTQGRSRYSGCGHITSSPSRR